MTDASLSLAEVAEDDVTDATLKAAQLQAVKMTAAPYRLLGRQNAARRRMPKKASTSVVGLIAGSTIN